MDKQFNTTDIKDITDGNTTIDDKIAIKELEERIESMKADKENKCKSAKKQLVNMLEVTVDKYRTATGTAEALRALRFAEGRDDVTLHDANLLARKMAAEATGMKEKAQSLAYAEMDKLCEGFYEEAFSGQNYFELAFELMRIDLCRNVGGAAEDMVEFIKRTQDEIDACGEKLKELKAN